MLSGTDASLFTRYSNSQTLGEAKRKRVFVRNGNWLYSRVYSRHMLTLAGVRLPNYSVRCLELTSVVTTISYTLIPNSQFLYMC